MTHRRRHGPARSRRAFALLVSLASLALLAALATLFVTISKVEQSAARASVDSVRAKLLAMSGVEYAIARLSRSTELYAYDNPRPLPLQSPPAPPGLFAAGAQPVPFPVPSVISGLTTTNFPLLANGFSFPSEWIYKDNPVGAYPGGIAVGAGIDIRGADYPSYRSAQTFGGAPTPLLMAANVIPRPPSGFFRASHYLGGTYFGGGGATNAPPGDFFTLKVLDCASQINLNHPDAGIARRLLENLTGALTQWGLDFGRPPLTIGPANSDTSSILASRLALPGQRFTNKRQILEVLLNRDPATAVAKFERIKDFITVNGFQDRNTVRPNQQPFQLPNGFNLAAEARFPVNVNTAHPAVLQACLSGIQGQVRRVQNRAASDTPFGASAQIDTEPVGPITDPQAFEIANAIAYRRANIGPFRTWSEFAAWLADRDDPDNNTIFNVPPPVAPALSDPVRAPKSFGGCFGSTTADLRRKLAALVWANANPNTLINRFNPTWPASRGNESEFDLGLISKADLGAAFPNTYTTEFCFSSMGFFEIESLGRVLRPEPAGGFAIQAERDLTAVAKIFDVARVTTQQDFEKHRIGGSNDISFPESMADIYELASSNVHPGAGPAPLPADGAATPFGYDGHVEMSPEWRGNAGATQYFPWRFGNRSTTGTSPGAPLPGGTLKIEDAPPATTPPANSPPLLSQGTDVAPDGSLSFRDRRRELNYPRSFDLMSPGAIEFWIKFAEPGDVGNDEVLFYAVQELAQGPLRGVVWKLEKFGNKLVSTRFLWWETLANGQPPPNVFFFKNPFPPPADPRGVYLELQYDIGPGGANWRSNEWHFVHEDWAGAGPIAGWPANGADDPVQHNFTTADVAHYNKNVPVVAFPLREGIQLVGQGLNGGDKFTTNRFRLGSNLNQASIWVGGYLVPRNDQIFYQSRNGNVAFAVGNNRVCNATMDELRILAGRAFSPPERYFTGSRYDGEIPLAVAMGVRLSPSARLGTLSWSVYYPPFANTNLSVTGGFQNAGGPTALTANEPATADLRQHGSGLRLGPLPGTEQNVLATGPNLNYRFTMNANGNPPAITSPWIDDVTATVLNEVRVLEWSWAPE